MVLSTVNALSTRAIVTAVDTARRRRVHAQCPKPTFNLLRSLAGAVFDPPDEDFHEGPDQISDAEFPIESIFGWSGPDLFPNHLGDGTPKGLDCDGPSAAAERSPMDLAKLPNVLQDNERGTCIGKGAPPFGKHAPKAVADRGALEVLFAAIMRVKSGTADIRGLTNVLDRNPFVRLARQELDERLLKRRASPPNAAVDRTFSSHLHAFVQKRATGPFRRLISEHYVRFRPHRPQVKDMSMSRPRKKEAKPQHAGLRLRSPAKYDLTVWLLTFGRPRRFRQRMLKPAKLRRGERVLDISCGTGSLALLAKEQVGPEGQVYGIDASEEMIAYADAKARRAGAEIAFAVSPAQDLPFEDSSFDVVLNTLALHHLPKPSRHESVAEMRRVLKPNGRALVVDFAEGKKRASGPFRRLKHRHGSVPPEEIAAAMRAAGFEIAKIGPVGMKSLHLVLAGSPQAKLKETLAADQEQTGQPHSGRRAAMAAVAIVAALVALHTAAGAAVIRALPGWTGVPLWWLAVAVVVLLAGKLTMLRLLHRRLKAD